MAQKDAPRRATTELERTDFNNVLFSMSQQCPFPVDVPRHFLEAEKFQHTLMLRLSL